IPGGHLLDPENKSGVANLLSDLMMEGTVNKTPADLEEAIGLLGASINTYSSNEDFHITGTCLAKNFDKTIALVKEIILQPRWDVDEFNRLKSALETSLKDRESNPNSIASMAYNKLIYGDNHILSIPSSGTQESISNISIQDLKNYFKNLSPENASFHIAGALNNNEVKSTLSTLNEWNVKAVNIPDFEITNTVSKNKLYFIDFPGAKQSVFQIGKLALSKENEEFNNLNFANEILGGGSSGKLFQTLRIEKGYTYGAYSGISSNKEISPFTVRTSVRANATLKSLEIIKNMISNYANDFTNTEVELTKNKILKGNTRAYESLGAQLGMLRNISKYNLSKTFTEEDQEELINMTLEDYKNIINKYLNEEDMIYVVVGDKKTQFEEVKKLGKTIIELDIYGNKL
ncbi:MAG: M16 family metallopeptidase, partial [Lacinutrix venerupis]